MTKDQAIEKIEYWSVIRNTTDKYGLDKEKMHEEADLALEEYLRGLGGEHAEVADAYKKLRETHGFWFA